MAEQFDITALPLILAGPILRRTEPKQVTVWLALKEPKTVTLRIYDQTNTPVLTGTRKTVALGAHLHVLAVTANQTLVSPLPQLLNWGKEYYYNLAFGESSIDTSEPVEDVPDNTLLGDGNLFHFHELKDPINEENREYNRRLRLSYTSWGSDIPGSGLPSFSMAPPNVSDLRLIHASCRKPHGEGVDQLAKLDELINPALRGAMTRPHLLFLTGDQIYADDVADQLLHMIMGWSEKLLVAPPPQIHAWPETEKICLETVCQPDQLKFIDSNTSEFKVGRRQTVMEDHGFTAGDVSHSHLIGLGEFYVMYLMAWSDRLWLDTLPIFKDIFPEEDEDVFASIDPWTGNTITNKNALFVRLKEHESHLKQFRSDLPKVRRALANIPCYMILDDHEITDDWYLHLEWCINVLGNPFGKRVIQNGMSAYAMFQAWGNTPDQFLSTPGSSFLDAIEKWRGDMDDENEKTIAKHLGIFHRKGPHPSDESKPGLRLGDLICQRSLDHPPEWYNFQMVSVDNDNEQGIVIEEFHAEFKPRNKECSILIVHSITTPNEWTIAGFNDEGEFKQELIDDSDSELIAELTNEPINESVVVNLATLKIGRASLGKLVFDWHYQVEGPSFQVLVMDTRTWRSFRLKVPDSNTCKRVEADLIGSEKPKELEEPPVLISRQGLISQLPTSPPPEAKEYLFVVSPAPVYGVWWLELVKDTLALNSKVEADYEDWALQQEARIEFLFNLESYINLLQKDLGKEIVCAFLTGDIHFSYCNHIELSSVLSPIQQRFINLTASALKNETKKTLFTQWKGVGNGSVLPTIDQDSTTGLKTRTEYVLDQGCIGNGPRCFPPANCASTPPAPDRTGALKQNECSSRAFQQVQNQDKGKEIVGRNNIGEVRFTAGTGHSRSVTQVLYWNDNDPDQPVSPQETHFKVTLGSWS